MDVISYSKAMKAKKAISGLRERLGEGEYKSGDRDIKDVHINTKKRLEELEKKRLGLIDKQVIINTDELFEAGDKDGVSVLNGRLKGPGVWEYQIDLGEDLSELGEIDITTAEVIENMGSLIPPMSSSISPIGESFSSSSWSGGVYDSYCVFDGNQNTEWHTQAGINPPHYIGFKFNEAKVVKSFYIMGRNLSYSPKSFRLQGFNGQEWVTIASYENFNQWEIGPSFPTWGDSVFATLSADNNTAYYQYRIYIDQGQSYNAAIREIEFYGDESESQEITRYVNDFTGIIVKTKTSQDFEEIDGLRKPVSKWSQKISIQVHLDGTRELDKLVINYKVRPLLNRVSEVEKNTHINLNKHNLRVNTILNHRRYKLKEMIVDDFGDDTGIDKEASVNITHNAVGHKVEQADPLLQSEVIMVREELEAPPTMFALSAVTSENSSANIPVDLSAGEFIQTEINNNVLSLKKVNEDYPKSGSWVSKEIDLGSNFKTLSSLDQWIDTPDGTSVKLMTATSNNNVDYQEFKEVNKDGSLQSKDGRFVKVKVEMTAKAEIKPERVIHGFTSEETADFVENKFIALNGSAKLQTSYSQPMEIDESFVGEGTMLSAVIDKTMFKTIEKVEVK